MRDPFAAPERLSARAPTAGLYAPISGYAIIGDSRCAALVSKEGSLDWLCLPHFSGSAAFAALLDGERGGRYAARPTAPFRTDRAYIGETNVLESTFRTATGAVRLIDLMPIPCETERERFLQPQRELLRIVEGLEGEVEIEAVYAPRPDFARARAVLSRRGKLGWACEHRDELLMFCSDLPMQASADRASLHGRATIKAGERRYLSLTYAKRDIGVGIPLGAHADERLRMTLEWWQSWSRRCTYDGPYRDAVVRSALALKLLAYALSGAVVAAPTTSLPEVMGGMRNWDYRFCWLRDAAFTLESFADLGYEDEARAFMDWLLHATRLTQPELQVLYDVHGETRVREEELAHLEGYCGSRPVRAGNGAHNQLQLDVYGEVVLAATTFVMRGRKLESDEAKVLVGFGRTVCKRWREPDHGIWEIRGPRKHYTYSKLMCWAALDCLLKLHGRGELRVPYGEFRHERDALRGAIDTRGYNDRLQSYVGVFDGDEPDASLLVMSRCGYKEPADPRMLGTYRYIERELGRNGLFYRYKPGSDGMPGAEGAFGACGFWAVEYLASCGRIDEARLRMKQLLSFANDVGLYGEQIDVANGAALGNFPQAFTHVALITAALAITRAERARAGAAA